MEMAEEVVEMVLSHFIRAAKFYWCLYAHSSQKAMMYLIAWSKFRCFFQTKRIVGAMSHFLF